MTAAVIAQTHLVRTANWVKVRVGSWTWRVDPQFTAALNNHPALSPEYADTVTATVIKRSLHRTISRWQSPVGELYLKHFHPADWRTRLRHWFRDSQARWEFSRYRRAVAAGIPTARVIALGKSRGRQRSSSLLTVGLSNVTPLDTWLAQHGREVTLPVRRQLARDLAQFLADLHQRGITHGDLHAGNLLLQDNRGRFQIQLVDLTALRFQSRPVTWRQVTKTLARVRHPLLRDLSTTDQTAFWQAYRRAVQDHPAANGLRERTQDLLADCQRHSRGFWRQMDRSWARGNRMVVRFQNESWELRGISPLNSGCLGTISCCLENWPGKVTDEAQTLLKVRQTLSREGVDASVRTCDSARRIWEIGHALHRRQIAAPVPVCLIESRHTTQSNGMLAMANELGWQNACTMDVEHEAVVRELGNRIVNLWRRFHELGFVHDRLTLQSFEVRQTHRGWQVRFADLDSIRQVKTPSLRRQQTELHQLAADVRSHCLVSRSMLLRWWRRSLTTSSAITADSDWRLRSCDWNSLSLTKAS